MDRSRSEAELDRRCGQKRARSSTALLSKSSPTTGRGSQALNHTTREARGDSEQSNETVASIPTASACDTRWSKSILLIGRMLLELTREHVVDVLRSKRRSLVNFGRATSRDEPRPLTLTYTDDSATVGRRNDIIGRALGAARSQPLALRSLRYFTGLLRDSPTVQPEPTLSRCSSIAPLSFLRVGTPSSSCSEVV